MIPCCYHPTRVIIVRGSQDLLRGIDESLSKTHMTFHSFENVDNALHYMNDVYQIEPFYERYVATNQNGQRQPLIDMHREIYRPERFEEISTVVFDLSRFTRKDSNEPPFYEDDLFADYLLELKNPYIQKVLVGHEQDERRACDLMRQGIVHSFVRRDNTQWEEELSSVLQDSQWTYFNKLSEVFMQSVRPGAVKEYALDDPNFQKLFRAILLNYGFTEAYLCESTGSYLFLDNQAQDHGLVVNIPEQLEKWIHNGKSKGIDVSLLKALKDRKKMMCYHSIFGGIEPDKRHWDLYAHPANAFKGKRSTYYYALAPNIFDIDVEKVLPFAEFRESQPCKVVNVQ